MGSSSPIRAASDLQPSTVEMSCGSEMQVPPPAESFGGRGVAVGGLARGDVDLGAPCDEALGDHLADAARAAGDQRRAPFE